MLKAKLVVIGGDPQQTEIELKLPTIIGRGREVDLTVPQALVSRRHTELFEKEGHLFVRDLGSLNGTFVNNKRIDSDQLLPPDQLLTLGTVTFRAIYKIGDSNGAADPHASTETISSNQTTDTLADADKVLISEPVSFQNETLDIDSIRPAGSEPVEFTAEDLDSASEKGPEPSNSLFSVDLEDDLKRAASDSSMMGSFLNNLPR